MEGGIGSGIGGGNRKVRLEMGLPTGVVVGWKVGLEWDCRPLEDNSEHVMGILLEGGLKFSCLWATTSFGVHI